MFIYSLLSLKKNLTSIRTIQDCMKKIYIIVLKYINKKWHCLVLPCYSFSLIADWPKMVKMHYCNHPKMLFCRINIIPWLQWNTVQRKAYPVNKNTLYQHIFWCSRQYINITKLSLFKERTEVQTFICKCSHNFATNEQGI